MKSYNIAQKGMTLFEVVLAMAMLFIIALGAMCYEYYAAMNRGIANADLIVTRTAQLILEDWKSTGGSITYDPTKLQMGFEIAGISGYDYKIDVDSRPVYVKLSYSDIDNDNISGIILRQISAHVLHESGTQITLTTYVRTDGAGG